MCKSGILVFGEVREIDGILWGDDVRMGTPWVFDLTPIGGVSGSRNCLFLEGNKQKKVKTRKSIIGLYERD